MRCPHRDFPTLSGTSQPQHQNTSQTIWANPRAVQQTPVQRPQHQQQTANSQAAQHQQNQQSQEHVRRTNDDMFSPSSHLQSALDDHRYGGASTLDQMQGSRQPQSSSVDDFPPLGRNGTDEADDRRGAVQSAGFGGFPSSSTFPSSQDTGQIRNPLPSASTSQANNTRSSSVVNRLTSPNGVGLGGTFKFVGRLFIYDC